MVKMKNTPKSEPDLSGDESQKAEVQQYDVSFLNKAVRYCTFRERCIYETREKIRSWGLDAGMCDMLIDELIGSGYLNDDRFAGSFVGSKFRVNGWGKIKITVELRRRRIDQSIICKALRIIGEAEYLEKLNTLLNRKYSALDEPDSPKKKVKVMNYGLSKGYENDAIFSVIGRFFKD